MSKSGAASTVADSGSSSHFLLGPGAPLRGLTHEANKDAPTPSRSGPSKRQYSWAQDSQPVSEQRAHPSSPGLPHVAKPGGRIPRTVRSFTTGIRGKTNSHRSNVSTFSNRTNWNSPIRRRRTLRRSSFSPVSIQRMGILLGNLLRLRGLQGCAYWGSWAVFECVKRRNSVKGTTRKGILWARAGIGRKGDHSARGLRGARSIFSGVGV